jgi:acyl-CoA thioesterase-2
MNEALSNLVSMLDLEAVGSDAFLGRNPGGSRQRVFGGHVAAQALMAAGRTVPGLPAHSLHAYFLRPGDPKLPIEYAVERLRDGTSFSTRAVVARQKGEAILHAAASFQHPEQSFEHQKSAPVVPPPAACVSWEVWMAPRIARLSEQGKKELLSDRAIDILPIDPVDMAAPEPSGMQQNFWIRADENLPVDPLLHQCLATYASDHTLLGAAMRPHGRTFLSSGIMAASLDHTIWFHRPFRMDQWLLYTQESPVAFGARGLAFGHFFDQQGVLVASMAQEGLIRQRTR